MVENNSLGMLWNYVITLFVKNIKVLFVNRVKRGQKKNRIQNKYN